MFLRALLLHDKNTVKNRPCDKWLVKDKRYIRELFLQYKMPFWLCGTVIVESAQKCFHDVCFKSGFLFCVVESHSTQYRGIDHISFMPLMI